MGGRIRSHGDLHHHEVSKLHYFSPQSSRQGHKQVVRVTEQTCSEPNAEESTEELTIDLSYQNGVIENPHHVSSSCPDVPDLGKAPVDLIFCKSNIGPRLESSYERLESLVSSDWPPLAKSCLREDTADPEDLFDKKSTVSKLKTYCYNHGSTNCLPGADSYIDFRAAVENSTDLIHKSNHFSRLGSSCYSLVSASYLPVPEPSLAYADFMNAHKADFLYQRSQMPKKGAQGYIHLSASYLPLPLTCSEANTTSVHKTNSMSGSKSCTYSHIKINNQKSCPDFEIEEEYRPLSAEECPLSF